MQKRLILILAFLIPTISWGQVVIVDDINLCSSGQAPIFNGTTYDCGAAGGGGNTTVIGNGLLTGGGVVHTADLDFTVAAATYLIGGVSYASDETDLTLDAADATNPRIDVFAVTTSGTVIKITGTPAATPAKPSVDPETQFEIGFAFVEAMATTPANFSTVDLYLENTEWTCADSANFDCASTSNPFAGSVDIKGTNAASSDNFTLTKPAAATEILQSYSTLSMRVRTDVAWPNAKSIVITPQNAGATVGNSVTLDNGTFGFNHSTTSVYQLVVIPVSLFNTGASPITTFQFTVVGGGAALSAVYFDNILLQAAADGSSSGFVQFVDQIVPTGAINSSNTAYTLPHIPNPISSAVCELNGVRGRQGASADYTVLPSNAAGAARVIYNTAPTTGDTLVCSYRH